MLGTFKPKYFGSAGKFYIVLYIGFPTGDKEKCNEIACNEIKCNEIRYFVTAAAGAPNAQPTRAVDFVTAGQVLVLGDPRAVSGKPG